MNGRFRIKGRQKWRENLEEMQKDLDAYLQRHNTERPHQGRGMNGKTPQDVFLKGIPKAGADKNKGTGKAA